MPITTLEKRVMLTLEEALTRATISVPDAGRVFFGVGRQSAYAAAKNGEIPTITVGKKLLVPVAPLAEKLGLRSAASGSKT